MTACGVDDAWIRDDESLMHALRAAKRDQESMPDFVEGQRPSAGPDLDEQTLDRMYAAASAAFVWRTVDEELELLTAADDPAEGSQADYALVRGAETPVSRTLEFMGRTIGLELEVGPDVIVGQILPGQVGHLTLLIQDGAATEFDSDDEGFFTVPRPGPGPFRVRCEAGDCAVITDWICAS